MTKDKRKESFLNAKSKGDSSSKPEVIIKSTKFKLRNAVWNIFITLFATATGIIVASTISFHLFVARNLELYEQVIEGINEAVGDGDSHVALFDELIIGNSGFNFGMLENHSYYSTVLYSLSVVFVVVLIGLILMTIRNRKRKKGKI